MDNNRERVKARRARARSRDHLTVVVACVYA